MSYLVMEGREDVKINMAKDLTKIKRLKITSMRTKKKVVS